MFNIQNEIHQAVWNWLFEGDFAISELSFLSASYDENGTIISDKRIVYIPITTGVSEIVVKYVRGSQMKYDFILQQYTPISNQSNTKENIKILGMFEDLATWANEQVKNNNLPILPKGCQLQNLIVNNGTVAGIDENGAKFQMIITINYLYNGG